MEIKSLDSILEETKTNVDYLSTVVDNTVKSYSSYLDTIMTNIYNDVIAVESASTDTIEKYFLELSNALYFVAENVEKVGIYDGVSKASAQQKYNDFYMKHQTSNTGVVGAKKPTVAESTAYAESESLSDTMVNEIYNRSYKILKGKIDAAQTMISTLSKVLSKRMSENQLTNMTSRRILNEGDIF